MTNIELAFTNLGEASAVEIHKRNTNGLEHLKGDVKVAGLVMKRAKDELEQELEYSIVSSENHIALTKKENVIDTK